MISNKYIYLSSLCLMIFGFTSQNLLSQSSDSRLEEVVVTAQKTESSLQDTPIAITAITEGTIRDLNIKNVVTTNIPIAKYLPNLFEILKLNLCCFLDVSGIGLITGSTNKTNKRDPIKPKVANQPKSFNTLEFVRVKA